MPVTGYTIFRPDGSQERGAVDWPENPGLELIKALVEPIEDNRVYIAAEVDPPPDASPPA